MTTKRPKCPSKLTQMQLATIVQEIQEFMFREDEGWNLDKDVNGGDLVELVVEIFKDNGLLPPKGSH